MPVQVELLIANGCGACRRARTLLAEVIDELDDPRLEYRELDLVEEIDYAVQLGVTASPAVAVDGQLLPLAFFSRKKLRAAIAARLETLHRETHR